MTDMAEKVAKALIEQIGSPWKWEEAGPEVQALWRCHARAAISALMEPTAEMLSAGDYGFAMSDRPIDIYRAMLKAALGD